MNLIISNKSDKPLYEQIYDQTVTQIINGDLPANYCLPSIRTVARELSISIITIKKAWELLENNNFIYTVKGKGCYVKEHSANKLSDKKFEIAREKVQKDIVYYDSLNMNLNEIINLFTEEYNKKN